MFVVELFLPLEDASGERFPAEFFDELKEELTTRFGGVTAFVRAPAEGQWKPRRGQVVHDQVVVFEVMVRDVDTAWWGRYRKKLERRLGQEQILVRLYQVTVL